MRGEVMIMVSNDMMSATAALLSGENELNEAYVKSCLKEEGVAAGIKKDAILKMLEEAELGKEYVVAVGKEAVPGKDGYYEFFFDTDAKHKTKPRIREDGTIDYSVNRQLVNPGDIVAAYHECEKGAFGYTVYATMIAPVQVKDKADLKFKVEDIEKRDNEYFALSAGEIVYEDDRLEIKKQLEIKDNVGFGQGNINFNGDVIIRGDVNGGVWIKAAGNVEITGIVEGAIIEAGKDIILSFGMHGNGKGYLNAGGSITAKFVEEAKVFAEDTIIFDSMYNSELTAKNAIIAEGSNGAVIGGVCTAGKSINVKEVGNEQEVKTVLQLKVDEGIPLYEPSIVVTKTIHEGARIGINGRLYIGKNIHRDGEFHRIGGRIERYPIGKFDYEPPKEIEEFYAKQVKKPLVLLVDDEPMILKTFYSFLSDKYEVLAANSGKDALAIMETKIPDLVVLDYMMPGMTGGELLEQMRKAKWKPYVNVPVIFATAVVDQKVILQVMKLYPQGYITKPINKETLLGTVDKFFEKQEAK